MQYPAWETATPHTRGSTCLRLLDPDERAGYPAHAGIDPSMPSVLASASGYPAHAGIDLKGIAPSTHGKRLPRTRGDRPSQARLRASAATATPHTRGSTSPCDCKAIDNKGYPAHAGIDLATNGNNVKLYRLPRTRGDRPGIRETSTPPYEATPHTRGSTSHFSLENVKEFGYPAHAGIDRISLLAWT